MRDITLKASLILLPFLALMAVGISWHTSIGFDATDPQWWRWLLQGFKTTGKLPQPMVLPLYVAGCVTTIGVIGIKFLQTRLATTTLKGGRGRDELHGSARWAEWKDVLRAGLVNKEGVVVGGFRKGSKKVTLKHNGAEHIMAFAPTRSGKGVGLVLPTLLTWNESVLVFDIKGENYALTAGYRKSIGQRVLKFEPTAKEGSAKFNPLEEVRLDTTNAISDCQNIAIMIIDPDGKGLKDYFMQAGYSWLTCAILHSCIKIRQEEGRSASLKDVAIFLSSFGDEEDFNNKLEEIQEYEHGREDINTLVKARAGEMLSKADKERSGVHGSAIQELSLYLDPIVSNNISASDFTVHDLMNGNEPVSLYLIVPPSDIDRLKPLFRIMMNIYLRRLTEKMDFKDGSSVKHYKHRLLLMMDEFTAIGKLEIFEKALAFMAGYGLKCFIIVQDLTQLEQAYGKEQSIVSNCHIRIAYAPNKIETANTLSSMCGETTIVQKKRSRSGTGLKASVSDSINETKRPLLTASECMQLPGLEKVGNQVKRAGAMLILPAGFPPIYGEQVLYFQDGELLERAKMPAPEVVSSTDETDNQPEPQESNDG